MIPITIPLLGAEEQQAAADVIRSSMEYMQSPVAFPRHVEFDTLFREEFEEPILRTGKPAADIAPQAARALKRVLR